MIFEADLYYTTLRKMLISYTLLARYSFLSTGLINNTPWSGYLSLILCEADTCFLGYVKLTLTSDKASAYLLYSAKRISTIPARAISYIPSFLKKRTLYLLHMLHDADLSLFFWNILYGSCRSGIRIPSLIQSSISWIPYQVGVYLLIPNRGDSLTTIGTSPCRSISPWTGRSKKP